MDPSQKKLTVLLWATLVVAMLGIIGGGLWRGSAGDVHADHVGLIPLAGHVISVNPAGASAADSALPVLYDAPAFSFTDQDGKKFSDKELRGHVYVVDFIFTHCGGPC